MAILRLENGTTYTEIEDIAQKLAPLNVQLNYWAIGSNSQLKSLLERDSLSDTEKEEVLQALDYYFDKLKQNDGYQERDLIVLNPDTPNLDAMLSKFNRCHTHADDEVRYIIAGEGVFGFVLPDRSQVELTIQPEEYINVPAGTQHWFYLTEKSTIKAVRYFVNTSGWIPEYSDTTIRFTTPVAV